MILVDTAVWVDHLSSNDSGLAALLNAGQVVIHPFVVGEIALGHLNPRKAILQALSDLPQTSVATDPEVLSFIDAKKLIGLGIGYIDAHLLAAVQLTPGTSLWTRDKRLHRVADDLGLATP